MKPHGPVSTENVLRLLDYQRHRCALTGRGLTPETSSLDHIVPIRCGGEHVIENTQVLHGDVNRAKGSLTNAEFIQLCREVAAHAARQLLEGSDEA
ncbi:MAG: HNH endonuclease signature motif containing protein [Planctomycetaceae bacterium]